MANLTPEEISEILAQFFDVTGKRQYIGARYVPIFGRKDETTIEWDNSKPYEPLTIVLYQGNSYTSRTYVPAGVAITDGQYWANTGNYNAQVESYREEVAQYTERLETVENDSQRLLTALPIDSFSDTTVMECISNVADKLPATDFDDVSVKEYIDSKVVEQSTPMGLVGITRLNNSTDHYLIYTADGENCMTLKQLPTLTSDSNAVFEYNGFYYYTGNGVYAYSNDFISWTNQITFPFLRPLVDADIWSTTLFTDANDNLYAASAVQYQTGRSDQISGVGHYPRFFRIDVYSLTQNDDGTLTVDDPNNPLTVLGGDNDTTFIDPYIKYTPEYGYIMACKNEQTSQIEVYRGVTLTTFSNLNVDCGVYGIEGPQLIRDSMGSLFIYAHGYSMSTVSAQEDANTYNASGNTLPNRIYFAQLKSAFSNSFETQLLWKVMATEATFRHCGLMTITQKIYASISKYISGIAFSPYVDDNFGGAINNTTEGLYRLTNEVKPVRTYSVTNGANNNTLTFEYKRMFRGSGLITLTGIRVNASTEILIGQGIRGYDPTTPRKLISSEMINNTVVGRATSELILPYELVNG